MVGKTKIIPNVVIDKIQAYPIPTSVKHLQIFLGLLGYWRVFVPYLAQVVHHLNALVKKRRSWDWTLTMGQTFQGVKCIIKCSQALHTLDPARPCGLDVHMTQEGVGWGQWQQSEQLCHPLGFWFQLWK